MTGLRAWHHTYAEALHSVRTGEPVFKRAIGSEFFDYFAAHPDEAEIFNGAMNDFGQVVSAAVVKAYDFSDIASIVDVGGGHGTLIAAILKPYPQMSGALYPSRFGPDRRRRTGRGEEDDGLRLTRQGTFDPGYLRQQGPGW